MLYNLEFAKEFFLGIQSFVNKTGNDTLVEVNIAIYLILKKPGFQILLDLTWIPNSIFSEKLYHDPTIKGRTRSSYDH